MPTLHLEDVPSDIYERLQYLAVLHDRTPATEAVQLLRQVMEVESSRRTQAELLADLRRRSFTPLAGTPDSVALLAEDRQR